MGLIRIRPLLYFTAGTGAGSILVLCPLRRKPISVYAVCFSPFVCLLNALLTEGGDSGDSGDSANAAELQQPAGVLGAVWLLIPESLWYSWESSLGSSGCCWWRSQLLSAVTG